LDLYALCSGFAGRSVAQQLFSVFLFKNLVVQFCY